MEQESEGPILYNTIKRVGSGVRLAIHLLFIVISFMGAVILLTAF